MIIKFPFRRILDVTARYADDPQFAPGAIHLKVGELDLSFNGKYGLIRWVAAPGEALIDVGSTLVLKADPSCDGLTVNMIYDVEPDDSLLPASWRDLRWAGLKDNRWRPDEDWRDRAWQWPLQFHRRRRKRAKLFSEHLLWVNGKPLQLSVDPLLVGDEHLLAKAACAYPLSEPQNVD